MANIGWATLSVIPSAKGFHSALSRDIDPGMDSLGRNSGRLLGLGLLAGAAVVVAGIGAIIKTGVGEAMDASAGTAQLAAGIKSTGNAANVSVKGLNALASSIQGYSGQTDDSIVQSEALLLTFTNIRNGVGKGADIFDRATAATANMAARMGGDAAGSAILLGKALNDPVKGMASLGRAGVQFTDAQKASIAAMVKAGDTMGAQKLILGELETQFGGAAEAAGKSLPGQLAIAQRSFEDVSQSVVEGLLPIVLPALTSIGTTLTTKVIPAVSTFVQGFKDGEGPGGKFRDILVAVHDKGIVPVASFINDTALPALKSIETWINDKGVPALRSMKQWFDDNKDSLVGLAGFITVTFLPVILDMSVKAVAAWVATASAGVTSAASELASHYVAVAGWVVHADTAITSAAGDAGAWISLRVEAATSAAAEVGAHILASDSWVGHAATAVVSALGDAGAWVSLRVEAATSAAAEVASHVFASDGWIAHAATAVVSALGDAGAWISLRVEAGISAASEVASHAFGSGGWISHAATAVSAGATAVGAWVALKWEAITDAAAEVGAHAFGEAGWIAHAATAMASGIKMAAAWVIGLGPVAWIIAAVVAVGAAMVWLYNNVDWFRAGVDWMWKGIQNSFTSSWNYVIQPVLVFLVAGLVGVMNSFGSMLLVLGQIPGFGWATDAGNKILGAAAAVRGFAADIKKIPADVPVSINVTANYSAAVATVLGGARAAVKLAGFAEGGTVLPTPGGTIVRVAEAGRKETIVDTASLNAAMAQKQKSTNEGGTVIHNWYVTGATPEALFAQFSRRQNAMVV